MEFSKSSHSLGESNFHFQFTPKYRRDVFKDVILKKACEESFLRIAENSKELREKYRDIRLSRLANLLD